MNRKKSKPANELPLIASPRPNAGFSFIESIVVLATIGVLVFITVPILKVYVFDKKDRVAPVYMEKRGTSESLPASSDGGNEERTESDASSKPAE